jgi:hypothetical protein
MKISQRGRGETLRYGHAFGRRAARTSQVSRRYYLLPHLQSHRIPPQHLLIRSRSSPQRAA